MSEIAIPYERLLFFRKKLDLSDQDLEILDTYREYFISQKDAFGRYFYNFFHGIAATRTILEYDKPPHRLERVLTDWFESLFRENLSRSFIAYLWRSGFKHVAVKLDQRYVNLGYAIVRQFLQGIIKSGIPEDQKGHVSDVLDKILDFCVLVATDSFVSATTQCDSRVINGIAHQVRNPIMIIGGNITRLQRTVEKDSPAYKAYETIIHENKRLERMVTDIGVYTQLFRNESHFTVIPLENLFERVLDELRERKNIESISIETNIDPRFSSVQGDANDLERMFFYLLENSAEAVSEQDPYIRISTQEGFLPNFVRIEIFNNGNPPKPEELDHLFTPFHSSKPTGTGFGLPIASLAARKNLGDLSLEVVPGEGTKCIVTLPAANKNGFRQKE